MRASFCGNCGLQFQSNETFCARCGASRDTNVSDTTAFSEQSQHAQTAQQSLAVSTRISELKPRLRGRLRLNPHGIVAGLFIILMFGIAFFLDWNIGWGCFSVSVVLYSVPVISLTFIER